MYNRLFRVARYLILSVSFVGLNAAVSAAEKIRIGWVYAMANTPILVAYHNGYFAQEGVQVELRRFNSGPLLKRALEADDLDMAYVGMPPVYHAIAEGVDIKIVAKVNYGQAALITAKNSPIKTLEDLKGKNIAGIRKGSGMDVLLKSFILKGVAGLDPDTDVSILHMPANMMVESVKHGIVDAAFTWEPYISFAVLTGGADVLFDMNEAVPEYPWYVIVANKQTRIDNRDAMFKILRAHKRAITYLNTSVDAGNDLIIETFRIKNALNTEYNDVKANKIVRAARGRLGWDEIFSKTDEKFLQGLMNYSFGLGFLKKKLSVDEVIDRAAIDWIKKQF